MRGFSVQRISLQIHTKNETVLERIREKRNIMQLIMPRKLTFFGHIIRRDKLNYVVLHQDDPEEDQDLCG